MLGADWAGSVGDANRSGSQRSGVGSSGIGSSGVGSDTQRSSSESAIGSSQGCSCVSSESSRVCVESGDGSAVAGPQDGLAVRAEAVEAAGVGDDGQSGEQNLIVKIIELN